MPRTYARLKCHSPDYPDHPFIFDVVLDADGKIENRTILGHSGTMNGEFWPFILDIRGNINYGSDYPDPDSTNIRTKKVAIGELITILEDGEEYVYGIREVNTL